jgi:DNA mismatch endonuclease, patch repair protein
MSSHRFPVMPDVFTKEKRSWVMSRIRGKDTKPELFVESLLREAGAKFEKHPRMVGNPDFAIKGRRLAIFVDGDFWHGYRMGPKKLSKLNAFWRAKIRGNRARDKRTNAILRREGWMVARIWEHDIEKRPDAVLDWIATLVRPGRPAWRPPSFRPSPTSCLRQPVGVTT